VNDLCRRVKFSCFLRSLRLGAVCADASSALELQQVACCFNHVTLRSCTTLLSEHSQLTHNYVLYPLTYVVV
jgi:hypothetical protein